MNRRHVLKVGSVAPFSAGVLTRHAAADEISAPLPRAARFERRAVFPLDALHNHSSCVVEAPNGDLLVTWYRGSGERSADDVRILGARLPKGSEAWSEPFVMADTPGFPDCNPAIIVDPAGRLRLYWPLIIANEWHTALLMERVSHDWLGAGPPRWSSGGPILFKPGEVFERDVARSVEEDLKNLESHPADQRQRVRAYLEQRRTNAADRYFRRMGWMPRAHPYIHEGKRLIVPLYSDGFDFSLMAISDDWGETWRASRPLVSAGGVQPSIARRRDGSLVAYMRDNGPPPKRLLRSESRDGGESWSTPVDDDLPNPGSGAEVITLRDGTWALIYNDTERGRHSLRVALSPDEGRTWPWGRHLERDDPASGDAGSYGYPSLIEARDGALHATYTWNPRPSQVKKDEQGRPLRAAVRHARFNREWIMQSRQ